VLDALKMFEGPVIELHISNIHGRDEAHRHSIMSASVKAVICGLGAYGYIVALQAAVRLLNAMPDTLAEPLRIGPT
jgi:3-dehydroquinate dehydratase II